MKVYMLENSMQCFRSIDSNFFFKFLKGSEFEGDFFPLEE